jgi:hypothetical protein
MHTKHIISTNRSRSSQSLLFRSVPRLMLNSPPVPTLLLLPSAEMSPSFSLKQIAFIFVASLSILRGAVAQTETRTLQDDISPRRHTIAKRARAFQCGQIKSNSAQYPNVCVCFDTLGTTVNFGESTAAVSYANSQGFKFPQSVSAVQREPDT